MTDVRLADAQVVWTPYEKHDGPPIRVVGGDVKDDANYMSSWGACNDEFAGADAATKLRMLLSESIHLTVNEGIDPKAVHEAFMVIPEYREAMAEASVIRPVGIED